jgi:F0F1-type ATP synthase membrane subunit b/b'
MSENLNDFIINLIQYGGISALAIYLMYKLAHNSLENASNEIRELRNEISKLRDAIEKLIEKVSK